MNDCTTTPVEIPNGYKRCSKGEACVHPDGPVLPANLDNFPPTKNTKSGLKNICKYCARIYSREATRRYRQRIKEDPLKQEAYLARDREAHKKRYDLHTEEVLKHQQEYRASHPEIFKEINRRKYQKRIEKDPNYAKDNYQKYKHLRKTYNAREDIKAKNRVENMTPEQIERKRLRGRNWHNKNKHKITAKNEKRRAALQNTDGTVTPEEIIHMYDIQKGNCKYCNKPLNGVYDLDHIHPLSRGGPHIISNVALACQFCNRSKGNKTVEEWLGR